MKQRMLWAGIWILLAVTAGFGQAAATTIYFPHIVDGTLGGHSYKTTIFLTNPAASGSLNATIMFSREVTPFTASGTPLSLAVRDESGATLTGSTIAVNGLGPGQSRKFETSATGAFAAGFATVVANATITGAATFADFDGSGRLIAEAGVPASSAVGKQTVFVDTVGGYNVGVAYSNPGAGAAEVQLRLLNAGGVQVATTTHTLGGGNHRAAFPGELFSAVPSSLTGTLQITSTLPLAALALRYDPTFTIFTTLPPVQIASLLAPPLEWLARRPWMNPLEPLARLLASVRFGRA